MQRPMYLTPDLVARVPPHEDTSGLMSTRSDRPTDAEHAEAAASLVQGGQASGAVWVFASGLLIWNPEFDFVEEGPGTVYGWHRSFCLGWVRIYRGTPENPGVLLAMDRGGSCNGVAFRLLPGAEMDKLLLLSRREMPIKRVEPPARWTIVQTAQGPIRAIAFPISRRRPAYPPELTEDQVVNTLSIACGKRGSMAGYPYSPVRHLEERGIHDRSLRRLKKLVADRLSAIP